MNDYNLVSEGDGFEIFEVVPKKVTNGENAAGIFRTKCGENINKQEVFMVMALDGASEIIYTKTIFIGTLNQSLVHPREVFSDAIRERAAGVIIAHNHPSGTLEASRADITITARLKESGKLLGIELLDHIIITENGYYSFNDEGIL